MKKEGIMRNNKGQFMKGSRPKTIFKKGCIPWNKNKNIAEFPTYRTIHWWVAKKFGKADKCENPNCKHKNKIFQWALIKGKKYERKRENFWMLCYSCHEKYDRKNFCKNGHKFTKQNTDIRKDKQTRICIKCRKKRWQKWKKRIKKINIMNKETCILCNGEGGHWHEDVKQMQKCSCQEEEKTPEQILQSAREEFVEKGADLEHQRWGRWQEYMFSKFVEHSNGKGEVVCLPTEFYKRWERQIATPYSELSEEEKESDRKETRNYLPLLDATLQSFIEAEIAREGIEKCEPATGHPVKFNYAPEWYVGYNQAKEESIKHFQELLVTLKR